MLLKIASVGGSTIPVLQNNNHSNCFWRIWSNKQYLLIVCQFVGLSFFTYNPKQTPAEKIYIYELAVTYMKISCMFNRSLQKGVKELFAVLKWRWDIRAQKLSWAAGGTRSTSIICLFQVCGWEGHTVHFQTMWESETPSRAAFPFSQF